MPAMSFSQEVRSTHTLGRNVLFVHVRNLVIRSVDIIGSGRKGMAALHVGMGHHTARVTSDDVENKNKTCKNVRLRPSARLCFPLKSLT
jgi:hypothetical protein